MERSSKEKYRLFLEKNKDIPVFYHDWWLDIVCGAENWELLIYEDKGATIKAIMPLFHSKLKILKSITNPLFTPYQGMLLFPPEDMNSVTSLYSFENKCIDKLATEIPDNIPYLQISFHPSFKNWYPLYWKGFEQSTRYTYILNNIKDHDACYSNFSNSLKRQIKKASEHYSVVAVNDPEMLTQLLNKSLQRQKIQLKNSTETIKKLYGALVSHDRVMLLNANDKNGETHAAMMIVLDSNMAYSLIIGMDHDAQKNDSLKLLLWESIKQASKRVDNYNFEGSMIRNVERVFRSFGGKRTPYFSIRKYRNRAIKLLFTLLNK